MSRFLLVALSFVLVGALGGCKKEAADTKLDLLVDKNWQVSALTVTFSGTKQSTQDAYALLPACQKDNYTRFSVNKTLEVNEGKSICQGSQQQAAGTWDINSDQTILYLSATNYGAPVAIPVDILELSASKLVLQSTVVQPEATTITVTTFSAQ
jgi:hypothetical protein